MIDNEEFYATIKLRSGEEIFSVVSPIEENDNIVLMLNHPVVFSQIKSRTGMNGFKVESWLKNTSDDLFIINMNDVITISESRDIEFIRMHQSFSRRLQGNYENKTTISRKMGYLSNVNDAKVLLEDLFNKS